MSIEQILFLAAALVAAIKIECAFQRMSWRTWPPRWLADVILLIAAAAGVREILANAWQPDWVPLLLIAGAALLLVFERRWPAGCKKP